MSATEQMGAWSRRRAAVQAETEALDREQETAEIAKQHAALEEMPEEEVLAELELPNPDEMQAGDDFSAFMQTTVPTALRNRALRTLWRSNPVLANVDNLVDYGDDFTGKNDVLKVVKTIYRVGKGMLKDEEETPEAPVAVEEAPVEEVLLEAEPEEQNEQQVEPTQQPQEPVIIADETPDVVAHRRRMRFDFDDGGLPTSTGMEKT